MATVREKRGLGLFVLVVFLWRIEARALPQGKVTQTGEPSHFQVDDKAAEIEVNANPAGVKVNAKPASLQVVAKPGVPAIPVYHPAIHVAPHYLPPPIIHRHPAMFFHGHHHHHCFPYCYGMSRGWFYSGLRRNSLPKPDNKARKSDNTRRNKLSKKGNELSRRDGIAHALELDDDSNVINRSHKSSIPRPEKDNHKGGKTHKRQFIAGVPQTYQPLGLVGLGASGYGVQPYAPIRTRAPLARNLISSFGGPPSNNVLGSLYGANGLSSLAGYGQPLSNNVLGAFNNFGQQPSNSGLGFYNPYGIVNTYGQSSSNYRQQSPSYGLGERQSVQRNPISNFMQSELNHELYGSTPTPSALGLAQGYGRSVITTPYLQPSSGLESLLSGRSINGAGGPYSGVMGSTGLGYGAGLAGYRNPALVQLAQMYAAQLSAMEGGIAPGLQQYGQSRSALPMLPYPFMSAGGRSLLVGRSKVPGSQNLVRKQRVKTKKEDSNHHPNETQERDKKKDDLRKKKIRRKRQALFQEDDGGTYDLSDLLQNALVNEYKRQMIFGTPQPEAQQLASLRDETQPLRIPLPGLQPIYDTAQQQAGNPLLRQLSLNALSADYVAPLDRYDEHNLGNLMGGSSRIPLTSMALGRSGLPPDELRMIPTMQQRIPMSPMEPSSPVMGGYPGPQPLDPMKPAEYQGSPFTFSAGYRSPIQFEDSRPQIRRKYAHHPLYRRRLRHHHPRYDDVYDDDNDVDEEDYDDDREMYHPEHLGKESVSLGGSYSENQIPSDQGETLVDTNNNGFGPITVEAKTAEGVKQSLGEDSRSDIAKPEKIEEAPHKKSSTEHQGLYPVRSGVL